MSEKVLGVDLGLVTTLPIHEVNNRYVAPDGRVYRYVRAGAAIALGDVLKQDTAEELYALDPTASADTDVIAGCWPGENPYAGTARAAIADNAYFWAMVNGDALVKAAATVVAGTPAIPIATAGTLDDTTVAAGNAGALGAGCGTVFLTTTTSGLARVRFFG